MEFCWGKGTSPRIVISDESHCVVAPPKVLHVMPRPAAFALEWSGLD